MIYCISNNVIVSGGHGVEMTLSLKEYRYNFLE